MAWNRRVERPAGDVLHHHVVDAVLFVDVVDDDDVGMMQRGARLGSGGAAILRAEGRF